MTTIWKFPFQIQDVVTIEMPSGAEVIHVGIQGAMPCMWAMVDSQEVKSERRFRIFGTGQPIDSDLTHVATFQEKWFVWHVFE